MARKKQTTKKTKAKASKKKKLLRASTRKRAAQTRQVPPETDNQLRWLTVRGARHNNLKNINVAFPLARFICVTGVSGSGKSSLVNDILFQRLARDLNGAEKTFPGDHDDIDGLDHLDKVIDIDQTPIGRTPRSNPATYIKAFDEVRALYAKTPDARVRGYKPGRFSFNVPTGAKGGGRCEACEGNGAQKMDMDFLADVWVSCPVCSGHRFNRETLQILFRGKSIADVLEMDVQDALEHFRNVPKIAAMLQTLHDVGLDYMKLGQSSTTLSGGEAQRIKLARELVKRSTGRTLYLLDEPTTGLHFEDIKRLLAVLHGFVDGGNTVVVIEHNLDVIKTADWIIDLGPEGGAAGGHVVAEGAPEDIVKVPKSDTGRVLAELFAAARKCGSGAATIKPKPVEGGRARAAKTIKEITVVGARQHNLKDITVQIPRDRMTVCSGPSGSGKTSLAIDTVYAEGQRRYVESLSAYARQFVARMEKPLVEKVEGLSPAISIEQKAASKSPRSTVGTVTEIYDYMRVLWARLGQPHCPKCETPIGTQTSDEIIERVMSIGHNAKALILAPIQRSGNENYDALFAREKANGYRRVRVDGAVYDLESEIPVDHRRKHAIELVVDRIVIRPDARSRITDSIEQALTIGAGVMLVQVVGDASHARFKRDTDLRFSQLFACDNCGTGYDELTPHHFSFNTRLGWCDACEGLGVQRGADPAAIITHPTRSILQGAIGGWGEIESGSLLDRLVRAVADRIGFDPATPYHRLKEQYKLALLQGGDPEWIDIGDGMRIRWRGFFPAVDRATRASWQYRARLEEMVTDVPCEHCRGSRLRAESRAVRLHGKRIDEVCGMPLSEALTFFKNLRLDTRQKRIAGEVLTEVLSRLTFLIDVGLEYITLGRSAPTLSGGESQRIRLASQLGSGLTGVLYVLDEPTIGLHPRDNARLIAALAKLRDLGNTLLLVEHDREVIDSADHLLDFGPGAGDFGGTITAAATPARIKRSKKSLTGAYLSGRKSIPIPSNRAPVTQRRGQLEPDRRLTVVGAYHNNLKEIDVTFPLGRFVCVTGVSGSGKSSLVTDVLYQALAARLHRARLVPGGHQRIEGLEHVDKVINVDQSPIGNSPSSNPATYTGLFDLVRELFARLPESKIRGYTPGRFSFNRPGGRCEACEGNGQRCIEMHFLPDVWVECEQCKGKRYTAETLQVRYRGHSVADVLEMRIEQALQLFDSIPKIRRMMQTLADVGLGYLQLGQPAPTLSGGEAQRVKLAAELGRPSTGKTVYILDEPTTGLHFEDLAKLLSVLHRLVDLGNTVICIEHNLDVIKNADWVIDLGPEAGDDGGEIVIDGAPEEVAKSSKSHTGRALAPIIAAGPYEERKRFDVKAAAKIEAELEAPLKLGDRELGVKMPWQEDGRQWHLVTHVNHHGQPAAWDVSVLEWIVEETEKLGEFAPTAWNHPSRIEIKAPGNETMWLLHARTRNTDQLDVILRVPKGTFASATLVRQLGITPLNDRDDLPIYSGDQRVYIRNSDKDWDTVRILLRDQKDLNKTTFRSFLRKAAQAYFKKIEAPPGRGGKRENWKDNAKLWHLTQGAMRARSKRPAWKSGLLAQTIGRLNKIDREITIDWKRKVVVGLEIAGEPIGAIVTNMPQGMRVYLKAPRNSVTPTQIEGLGFDGEIRRNAQCDEVLFWMRSLDQVDVDQLKRLVQSAVSQATSEEPQAV